MKKILAVLTMTLALNFLAAAGGVGWLFQSGRLDRARVGAIKAIVFPATQPDGAATQPADDAAAADPATTQPMLKIEQLLAQSAGRPAGEQVEGMQHSFDIQMALLDRRQREILSLKRQVDLAQSQIERDRNVLKKDRTELTTREQEAARLATDQGFQDSLKVYQSMPSKQVKNVFMSLDEPTMRRYLQAMEPRQAAKIIKEFKTPDELERVHRVLEAMRESLPTTQPAAEAAQAAG